MGSTVQGAFRRSGVPARGSGGVPVPDMVPGPRAVPDMRVPGAGHWGGRGGPVPDMVGRAGEVKSPSVCKSDSR